jgi:hypothetical protein
VRTAIAFLTLLAATAAQAAGTPPASCPIGKGWTQTWTRADPTYGTTLTYSITSPCYVTFDSDFVITTRVSDPLCVLLQPDPSLRQSGFRWNVTDTRFDTGVVTTIAGARVNGVSSFAPIVTDSSPVEGEWVATVKQHYGPGGTPTDHRIKFTFTPRVVDGCSLPGMGWSATLIGTTTYDPYAETTLDPLAVPTDVVSSDNSTSGAGSPPPPAVESGGCGSTGVAPALIGLAALAAAGWPRRRRS